MQSNDNNCVLPNTGTGYSSGSLIMFLLELHHTPPSGTETSLKTTECHCSVQEWLGSAECVSVSSELVEVPNTIIMQTVTLFNIFQMAKTLSNIMKERKLNHQCLSHSLHAVQ